MLAKWFEGNKDVQLAGLTREIEKLSREVASLKGEKNAITEQRTLEDKVHSLKKTVVDLEITRDKKQEEFDRRERDLTHMIGLEKKRQEVELKQASTDAKLAVREENLKAERETFEKQMKFRTDQFDTQIKYLQNLMEQVLGRVPTVTVDRNITETRRK